MPQNKTIYKLSFFLFVINLIYSLCELGLIVYMKQKFFEDFSETPVRLSMYSPWILIPAIMGLVIFTGLYWIMYVYKEKWWIQAGMIIFTVWKIAGNIYLFIPGNKMALYNPILSSLLLYGFYFDLCYMLVTSFLMHTKQIKWYYFWFTFFTILTNILPIKLGPYLHDNFGINWLMINGNILMQTTTLISLFLYLRVMLMNREI